MNLMNKLVIKNLKLNRKRTIVTVVGIILAVALLSALSSLVMSFRSSLVEFEKNKNGDFHVKFNELHAKDLEELKRNVGLTNIRCVKKVGYSLLEGCANPDKPYAYVMATDKKGMETLGFKPIEGRLPERPGEIMISRHLKTNGRVNINLGDSISLKIGNRMDKENAGLLWQYTSFTGAENEMLTDCESVSYTVVGICERPGYSIEGRMSPGYSFITYDDMSELGSETVDVYARFTNKGIRKCYDILANLIGCDSYAMELAYGDIRFENFPDNADALIAEFEEARDKSVFGRFETNTYLIQYERLWPIDTSFRVLLVIGSFVALIIVFTSVYCIKNSFEISVTEKIRQYGMLAGIGATKKQISRSVHTEAALMGCVGIPVGVASGLLAAYILIRLSNVMLVGSLNIDLIYSFSLAAIIAAVLLGILTIYLSALSGARKAARVTPIEAIRNSNEIKNSAKAVKMPRLISKLWGIGGAISYKNIKRNRRKYRTTVVSIVICTVTFIVMSYFTTVAFDMVSVNVAEDECNLFASMGEDVASSELLRLAAELDGVEKASVLRIVTIKFFLDTLSDEYIDRCMNGYPDITYAVNLVALDKESFEKYTSSIGAGNVSGKAVLVNNMPIRGYGEVKIFDYKKGDSFEYIDWDYKFSNDEEELIRNRDSVTGQLEIGAVTDVRPFGSQSYTYGMIVVEEETLAKSTSAAKAPVSTDVLLCLKTQNADGNQDSLEKIFEEESAVFGTHSYINNRDKNAREERSLLTLLAIFAYGLITVIALIGVTNIINTIGTGMELRAREFAMLRSVGMTNSQFEKMVRLESMFTSAKALFWGCLTGIGISFAIWEYEVHTDLVIPFHAPIGAALMCSVTVLVMVYLIIRISLARINKRNIIETIKNENL